MDCDYYTHIIPSKERKQEIHDAIKADDYPLINKLKREMYNSISVEYSENEIIGGMAHVGKRSVSNQKA